MLDVVVAKLKFLRKTYFDSGRKARAPCKFMEL